jgi:competence protein ComEA
MDQVDSDDHQRRIKDLFREYGFLTLIGAVGMTMVAYSVWMMVKPDKPVVEIVGNQQQMNEATHNDNVDVFVDVSGAVEKPAVYKLSSKSRIGDALVQAGGLAENADREYVSKTVNLAQPLKDGQKIFIPAMKNVLPQQAGSPHSASNVRDDPFVLGSVTDVSNTKININTASASELDGLWGIGEARAQTIIANRPYNDTNELVTKAKIPQSTYDKIKDQISIY